MGKRIIKLITGVLLLAVIAFLLSCIVVPLVQKKAEPQIKEVTESRELGSGTERVMCLDDNTEALIRRLQVIDSAREELIFTTFAYNNDECGRDMAAALHHAAERGVKVRILVDGWKTFTDLNGCREFRTLAGTENVEVRVYNPVNFLKPWKLNYRMHDKYVIADSSLYILGGRNTKNVSLGDYQKTRDIDRDVLVYCPQQVQGDSLAQLRDYFEYIWQVPETKPYHRAKLDETLSAQLRRRYIALQERHPEAFITQNWMEQTTVTDGITLLSNPVAGRSKEPVLWNSLCSLMEDGKDIIVQTPYMVCNRQMYDDLARLTAEGKNIQVITNAAETGANPCGCADYLNQKRNISKAGIEVYEYVGEHSSHTKSVLIDDRISVIGSFNWDMRSTYLDTELMLVIDCPELNAHLRTMDEDDMEHSRCVYPDGTETLGVHCEDLHIGLGKQLLYGVLRVLILPLRHLL